MTINIQINSIYAYHIYYIASLLKVDVNIISNITGFNFETSDYNMYYQKMLNNLYKNTGIYLESKLFDWYIKNIITFISATPDIVLTSNNIKDVEYEFYEKMQNYLVPNIHLYEKDFQAYKDTISWSFEKILGRPILNSELDYYYIHNGLGLISVFDDNFINLFTHIHILYFCKEARDNGYHLQWMNSFKPLKLTLSLEIPKFALLLSGHSRDFINHYNSHKVFIENPYIDIFIHTWIQKGPRHEYERELADISLIINLYKPSKILVEDEIPKKNIFSLRDRVSPIFVLWGWQQGDDASKYTNSKLYSMWKAMTLMEDYETENNIQYDGIIRMNFNLELKYFDFKGITEDIKNNILGVSKNAIYLPNVYFKHYNKLESNIGGGCSKCDLESKNFNYNYIPNHIEHYNDLSMAWFYGKRNLCKYACELYLTAESIYTNAQGQNMINYLHVRSKRYNNFIYIQQDDVFQGKVYSINNQTTKIICFNQERLMREHLKAYPCLTSNRINCIVNNFDLYTHKI